MIYLIIILIILIIFLIYINIPKKVEGYLNTFNGRMVIDDQYFYDQLFDDVFYYPNEPDGTTGWIRCKTECTGKCVEFGVTGNSYCFPY